MPRTSENISDLAAALVKAQAEFVPVPKKKTATVKTKTGGEYSYKYADLADVLSMAIPILSRHGLAFSQPHIMSDGKLRVATMLLHSSGQWMQSDGIEISEEGDAQQFGGESTYFRRYDGCSFLGIAPDEDTDTQQAATRQRSGSSPKKDAPVSPDDVEAQRVKWLDLITPTFSDQFLHDIAHLIAEDAKGFVTCADKSLLTAVFNRLETADVFSAVLVPLQKTAMEMGCKSFVKAVADKAKERGYKIDRVNGTYIEGPAA